MRGWNELAQERVARPKRDSQTRTFMADCIARLSDEQRTLLASRTRQAARLDDWQKICTVRRKQSTTALNVIRRTLLECLRAAIEQQGPE